MNIKNDKHILVIDAGIIGARIAYHLSKAGIHTIHGNNLGTPKVGPMRGRLKPVFNIDKVN